MTAQVPGVQVVGQVGRRTSFEVKVNGVLVHSKLSTSAFPDFKESIF
jgi:selenoprotein W-related protein